MRSKEIEQHKTQLKLTKIQREILAGTLLGDGHLETQNDGKTYRLKIEHSISQKDYIEWLYSHFKIWIRTEPKIKMKEGKPSTYSFTTYSHGSFRFYAQKYYIGKVKHIPKNIGKMLTVRALAVWFMDDGSIKSSKHSNVLFHTLGYDKKELDKLQLVMLKKFNLKTSLHKQKQNHWRIYIASESMTHFKSLVEPYILPSMMYKLGTKMPKG